jgi:hypothetical protein
VLFLHRRWLVNAGGEQVGLDKGYALVYLQFGRGRDREGLEDVGHCQLGNFQVDLMGKRTLVVSIYLVSILGSHRGALEVGDQGVADLIEFLFA